MLTLPATVFVQAQKGENLVDDYFGFIGQIMSEHEQAMQSIVEENRQLADTRKKQLRTFYLDKLSGAKENVEQHQKDYLLQLEETKENLKERNLKEFEEQKAIEIQNEIGQDVEKYLEEILSEK